MSNQTLSINNLRNAVETLPLSPRSTAANTNSPSFHVMRLPSPPSDGGETFLRNLTVEYCIQPLGAASRQAIWWTSYVVLATRGSLTRGSGVYSEWNEFGTVPTHPATGLVVPRASGFQIIDTSKGVLNGNQTNGTVLRVANLTRENDVDIYAVLVASGMHDGAYQVHGQARLEYSVRGGL